MANVNVKFNNKDYLLSCDEGQEESLKELANYLDSKYSNLKKDLGNLGENKLLLITAIQMVDNYFDLFKKVKVKKDEFENLSIIKQHKMIYDALGTMITNEIHALQIKTFTLEQWKNEN